MEFWILIPFIFFIAALEQEIIGFGVSLSAMLLFGLFGFFVEAIPVVALLSLVVSLIVMWQERQSHTWKYAIPLVAGAVVGVPIGLVALARIQLEVLPVIMAIFLCVYAVLELAHHSLIPKRLPAWVGAIIGFCSGIFGGAMNLNGPMLGAYATSQGWPRATMKFVIACFLAASGIIIVVGHAFAGRMTLDTLGLFAIGIPGLIIGTWTGFHLSKKISPATSRIVVLVGILVGALALLFLDI